MIDIFDFLPYIAFVFSALVGIINLVYTRNTGKSIDKELNSMFLNTLTLDKKPPSFKKKYSPLIKTYRLDEVTGELVENPDLVDVDKLVESCRSSTLSAMLDRFLPKDTSFEVDGILSEVEQDLGSVGASLDTLEEYREKFGLSDEVPVSDVLKRVEQYREELLQKSRDIEAAKKAQSEEAAKKARLIQLQQELAKLEGEVKKDEKA